MYARLVVVLLCLSLWSPVVLAQSPNVRARIVPQFEEVALAPSQRGGVDLDVTLQVSAACTTGTQFGVTVLMVDPYPKWAGASPEPANLKFNETGGSASSVLDLFPAEDAPAGESVTYRLRPEVKLPASSNCTGELRVDFADALVKLTILAPDGTGPTTQGGDSPGFGVPTLGLLLGGWAFLRRRR